MIHFLLSLGVGLLFCGMLVTSHARVIGSGRMITENRAVSSFHGVELSAPADLTITLGDSEKLTVEAEDNIAPLLEAAVENGILHLRFKESNVQTSQPITLRLTAKMIDALTLAGSGSIQADQLKASDTADLRLPGSGTITIGHLETPVLNCSLAGSGNVHVSGSAARQNVKINGSGDFDGANLPGETVAVTIDGSGNAEVNASQHLDVKVRGSGEVTYHGSPTVTKKISGSGEVRAAN